MTHQAAATVAERSHHNVLHWLLADRGPEGLNITLLHAITVTYYNDARYRVPRINLHLDKVLRSRVTDSASYIPISGIQRGICRTGTGCRLSGSAPEHCTTQWRNQVSFFSDHFVLPHFHNLYIPIDDDVTRLQIYNMCDYKNCKVVIFCKLHKIKRTNGDLLKLTIIYHLILSRILLCQL